MVVALIKMMAPSTSPQGEPRQSQTAASTASGATTEIQHVDEVAGALRAGDQLGHAAGGEGGDDLRELRDAQHDRDRRREHGGRAPRRPGPNRRCISTGWMPDSAVHTAMADSENTAT